MDKIRELSIPNHARIIVISDIHGELELFQRLLDKVQFSKEDYLIINGDLCEKGSNSMGVVQYIMELEANNPKVHVIEGNCDTLVEYLLNEDQNIINYLCTRKHSIMNEWLENIGYKISSESSVKEVKEQLWRHFSREIKWLTELPTAIETDHYIFVHAGLEDIENWKDTSRVAAISIPEFLLKSHQANKYVIVGHWPVGNYTSKTLSNNPIIDQEKKIIANDGGNNVKLSGQLNAFIITPSSSGDNFSHTYVDRFPTTKVIKQFNADSSWTGSISYVNYALTPIEKGEHFTLCKQPGTDQLLYVKNEYILQKDRGYEAKEEVSCTQISVEKEDIVSIIDDSCAGYALIKKDGFVGWVAKEAIE
ncbi:serine/threonine protein phosphatase [Heyndrickxia shackletonii]|uniref:Serine/threonine protein phosphatase n=1 Tax=Heyndrickxia shackletonii TaxID=157838 RepID=A0A0Q3WPU2_9BACI|nr:metallophosphoesterase [Heyndrickxia shackletonii]KQL50829.1 serine/threonine protein phosphatase [Heyndrickxia shackletonii]NEY99792.1 serine/threonine protein phosphatase [Heyndrickxia shackletonii]